MKNEGVNMDGSQGSPIKKTHLERLRDQYSAALSQINFFQDKAAKLIEEIMTIEHKERGVEVGFTLKNRDGLAVVTRVNQYWIFGQFLKKDGTPGKKERIIFPPYAVISAAPTPPVSP